MNDMNSEEVLRNNSQLNTIVTLRYHDISNGISGVEIGVGGRRKPIRFHKKPTGPNPDRYEKSDSI